MRLFGRAWLPAAAVFVAELLISGTVMVVGVPIITAALHGALYVWTIRMSATGGIDIFRGCLPSLVRLAGRLSCSLQRGLEIHQEMCDTLQHCKWIANAKFAETVHARQFHSPGCGSWLGRRRPNHV